MCLPQAPAAFDNSQDHRHVGFRPLLTAHVPAARTRRQRKVVSECRPTASLLPIRPGGFRKPLFGQLVYQHTPSARLKECDIAHTALNFVTDENAAKFDSPPCEVLVAGTGFDALAGSAGSGRA
jgi:hypothetical protein